MKSGRLLEMLLLLQARGQVTAAELAERLEVSPRTVYRDAGALSSAGVPIYTERGRAGGIRLLPGYRTDVTGLTQDEARALFVLTTGGAHEDLGLGNAARSAVLKVMRAVPEPFRPAATATSQRILVDPARWMRGAEPVGHLGVLQAAVDGLFEALSGWSVAVWRLAHLPDEAARKEADAVLRGVRSDVMRERGRVLAICDALVRHRAYFDAGASA